MMLDADVPDRLDPDVLDLSGDGNGSRQDATRRV